MYTQRFGVGEIFIYLFWVKEVSHAQPGCIR